MDRVILILLAAVGIVFLLTLIVAGLIVTGAAIILLEPPASTGTCLGSMKFTVPEVNKQGTDLRLVMTNATGQTITNVSIESISAGDNTKSGVSATGVADPWPAAITNNDILFTNVITSPGQYSVSIAVNYDDLQGYRHSELISCYGAA